MSESYSIAFVVSIFNLLPTFLLEIDKDFENMLRDVIDSIKVTNPMIRMHLQYQNIVIVVGKFSTTNTTTDNTIATNYLEKSESILRDRTLIYI
ncbi:hypothetical protein Igag_1568 [Ignisphaera aggregans DSM 17230]|uniref:Uncharacterized protein n=1 Tax=Ignisphaera aggregans (strain DSM 17230 / JCM 13409 / AQ1.S1) TaxID=583356 RepID=E0SRB6_IGNAA|nr:hypothetical protein Igag_1568 [Ignisphaera aggregans DSM 17230]